MYNVIGRNEKVWIERLLVPKPVCLLLRCIVKVRESVDGTKIISKQAGLPSTTTVWESVDGKHLWTRIIAARYTCYVPGYAIR